MGTTILRQTKQLVTTALHTIKTSRLSYKYPFGIPIVERGISKHKGSGEDVSEYSDSSLWTRKQRANHPLITRRSLLPACYKAVATVLLLIMVGIGNVWATTAKLTLSNSNKFGTSSGSTKTDNQSNTWTCTGNAIQNSYQSTYSGQQFGTGKNAGNYTFTCAITGATISSVKITAAAGSTSAKYSISIGGTSKYSGSLSKTSTTYGGTNATGSGEISIALNGSGTGAAVYLGSIEVIYTTGSTYSVTYNLNGGSGTTPTESNKAKDATFTLHNGTTGITAPSGKMFSKWKDQDDVEYNGGATYTMPAKNVTLTAQWVDLPKYTVTYNAGTGTCATSSWTQGSYGASTTLPTATPPATCSGWSFAGWCTSSAGSADDNTSSLGTILTGSYTPTGNVTLYAVYTKTISGGGSASLTKMVTGNTLADGDKIVVVANGTDIAMYQETTSTSYVQTWDCSTLNTTTVSADDKNWWDITATTEGFYLGDETNGYLNMSSNNLYCNANKSVWTLSDLGDGTFKLQSSSRNLSYRSDLSTTKWRMGGANNGTSGNTILDIYKYSAGGGSTTYYMTSLVCCQNLGTINGSVNLSQSGAISFVDGEWDEDSPSTTFCYDGGSGSVTVYAKALGQYKFPTSGNLFSFSNAKGTPSQTYTESTGVRTYTISGLTPTDTDEPIVMTATFELKAGFNVTYNNLTDGTSFTEYVVTGETSNPAGQITQSNNGYCDDDYPYFVGWTKNTISEPTTTKPADLNATYTVTGTGNVYYAVFSDTEPTATDLDDYTSNIMTIGSDDYLKDKTNAVACSGTINGSETKVPIARFGTGSATGSARIKMPKGATSLQFYACGWNGESTTLTITSASGLMSNANKGSITAVATQSNQWTITLTSHTAASGTSPYSLTGISDTYKYTCTLAQSEEDYSIDLTFATSGSHRCLIWGMQVETSGAANAPARSARAPMAVMDAAKYITSCPACEGFSLHTGTRGGSDWAYNQCFVDANWGADDDAVYDTEFPSTNECYVGWAGGNSTYGTYWAVGGIKPYDTPTSTRTLGWNSNDYYSDYPAKALGTFHIYKNSKDQNYYLRFKPTGYILRTGTDGSGWTSREMTVNANNSNYYETSDVITLSSSLISENAYVDLKANNAEGHVWSGFSKSQTANSNVFVRASSSAFRATKLQSADAGMIGKFRIDISQDADNWKLTFVPYWHVTYNLSSNSGTGTGTVDAASLVSVNCEGNDAARTVPVSSKTNLTAPANMAFKEWRTNADGTGIKYDPADNIILTSDLTLYAIWEDLPTYTVSFNVEGGKSSVSPLTESTPSAGVILPSATPSDACASLGWEFAGWADAAQTETTTAPMLYASGSTYHPADNVTLHAVYQQANTSDVYSLISSDITTGDYIISTAGGKALSTDYNNTYYPQPKDVTISDNKIDASSVADNTLKMIVWNIQKSNTTYQLYNEDADIFFEFETSTSGNKTYHNIVTKDNSSGETSKGFTASFGANKNIIFTSINDNGYQIEYYGSQSRFSAYNNQDVEIFLYKRGATYNSNPACTPHTLSYNIKVNNVVTDAGTVTLDKTSLVEGDQTTATAERKKGYQFDHWSISGTGATISSPDTDNPITVTMGSTDAILTAHFTTVTEYSVNWSAGGDDDWKVDTYEENTSISSVPLIGSTEAKTICMGKEFVGWTTSTSYTHGTSILFKTTAEMTSAGLSLQMTADRTYYAVFATKKSSTYTQVTSISALEAGGNFYLATGTAVGDNAYTGKSGSNNYGGYFTLTTANTFAANVKVISVTVEDGKFSMHDGSQYLYYTGSSNTINYDNEEQIVWQLGTDGIIELAASTRTIQYNSGSPRFATYTSKQTAAYLYEETPTFDTDYSTTCEAIALTGLSLANQTIDYGEVLQLTPTYTPANASYKDVTWSSANSSVVSVNENGYVTGEAIGSTTITVTSVTYPSITATCTVTVSAPSGTQYVKVTSLSDVFAGGTYILVNETAGKANGVRNGTYLDAVNATILGSYAYATGAGELTLGGTTDAWTFSINESGNDKVLGVSSTKDGNKLSVADNAKNLWTIAITDGDAAIVNTDNAGTSRNMQYNSSVSRFTNYSGQSAIQLYRLACDNTNLSFGSANYAGDCEGGSVDIAFTITTSSSAEITYEVKKGGAAVASSVFSVNGTTKKFTVSQGGTYIVTARQAATGDYCTGSAQCTVTVTVTDVFVDGVQGTVVENQTNDYAAPRLTDKSESTGCKGLHYHFVGWLAEEYVNDRAETGALTTEEKTHIVAPDTPMTATGKTYYAIWAEEDK